jgi:type IV pilus assembly protein PilE
MDLFLHRKSTRPFPAHGHGTHGHGRGGGFTLIELMIVVAVIAILAAIAYPSYQEYVRKSRRAQAKADLVELAQLAERYHTVNNTYDGFEKSSGGSLPITQSPREAGATAHYTVAMDEHTQSSFTFTAKAASEAQEKDRCGDLGINQAGVKTSSKGAVADCW